MHTRSYHTLTVCKAIVRADTSLEASSSKQGSALEVARRVPESTSSRRVLTLLRRQSIAIVDSVKSQPLTPSFIHGPTAS